ncbi:hypothetical protein FM106_05850 [Brachybacterium faecium]|nr:hypothetical protein FM106_05850 [Brachybacterium faecium]
MKINLNEIMEHKNMSFTELAERTGISRQALSIFANKKTKSVHFNTLEILCKELDVSIGQLLTRESDSKIFRYRLPHLDKLVNYLNYDAEGNELFYNTAIQSQKYQTRFTRKEYEEIAKKHDIPADLHIEEEV